MGPDLGRGSWKALKGGDKYVVVSRAGITAEMLCHKELSSVLRDDLDGRDGKRVGGDICILIADSHCCTEETNTTL